LKLIIFDNYILQKKTDLLSVVDDVVVVDVVVDVVARNFYEF
jgi:hypothetical protein